MQLSKCLTLCNLNHTILINSLCNNCLAIIPVRWPNSNELQQVYIQIWPQNGIKIGMDLGALLLIFRFSFSANTTSLEVTQLLKGRTQQSAATHFLRCIYPQDNAWKSYFHDSQS